MRRVAIIVLGLAAIVATPAGARQWSSPTPVPGSDGVGYPYDVAVAPDGAAAVAFVRNGIRVAVRLPNGRWSRPAKVSTGDTGVSGPDIAVDAAGELLVAWTQSRVVGPPVGRNEVRVAIRAPNGRWSRPHTVGATEHFIDSELQLRANPRGDAVLGWRGVSSGGHDLLQAAYRPAQARFGGAHSLGEAGFDLRVAIGTGGIAYAVWTHLSPPMFVQSSVRLGVRGPKSWHAPVTVAGPDAGGPQIALSKRHALIVWRQDEQGIGATRTGLTATTDRGPDGTFTPIQVLADNPTPGPQIAVGPTGERLIVWADATAPAAEPALGALSWSVGSPDGTFSPVQRRLGVGAGQLVMIRDGTAVVVWGTAGVQEVVRRPGGAFGRPQTLSSRGAFPVISAGTRSAVAVWLANGRLMAARRGASG
jgi:hypothetical protein